MSDWSSTHASGYTEPPGRSAEIMSNEWTPELLAIHSAIVSMGTFAQPLDPSLDNVTLGAWQLERAKRVLSAISEVQATPQWERVPDGQIPGSNLWIVSAHDDGWFLEFGKNGAKVWFPGAVRLFLRPSTQEPTP